MSQSEASWLSARKSGITGTDCAVIMGDSPWKNKLELWREKVGIFYEKPKWQQNRSQEPMQMGHELEKIAARDYARSIGKWLVPGNFTILDWRRGTPDFTFYDEKIGLEVKTTAYDKTVKKLEKGEFEKYWEWQCRWYMMLMDYDEWHLTALAKGQKRYSVIYQRDYEIECNMINECSMFWHNNVLKLVPPEDNK